MSGGCEKKIIYVGKSKDLLDRLIDHFCAMDALKENIIERVCKKAHENIYYYMNPYLWHPDVEVVVITLKGKKAKKVLEIKEILNNISGKIEEKLRTTRRIKENDLKIIEAIKNITGIKEVEKLVGEEEPMQIINEIIEVIKKEIEVIEEEEEEKLKNILDILEEILISILNPELNKEVILKKVRQLALQSSISEDLKSYLCNYGLKIREMVKFKELLKNLKGFYVIKHKMLPEEFEDTKRAKRFREFTMDIFCEFLKKKERKA